MKILYSPLHLAQYCSFIDLDARVEEEQLPDLHRFFSKLKMHLIQRVFFFFFKSVLY